MIRWIVPGLVGLLMLMGLVLMEGSVQYSY